MKNTILFLPLLIPLITAVLGLLAWRRHTLQRLLGVGSTSALLAVGLLLLATVRDGTILSVQAGNWPAPFGITLAADLFSALMVTAAGGMGLCVTVYSLADTDTHQESLGYHPLLQVLLLGVSGSFLTADLFNLYVWFEVMLIASFVLLALGGRREQMEGAIKYVALNLIASAFFLAGIGLLYGVAGTLNMAHLAVKLRDVAHTGTIPVIAALFFAAFGIKAAVFPFYFWLPASYHTPPTAVTTIFSALLSKVGIYVLFRVFTLIFAQEAVAGQGVLLTAATGTMLFGALGATAQPELRRMLSFCVVSQIGYLLLGLGIMTPLALAGSIFFILHIIAAKSALFLATGLVVRISGSSEMAVVGGLYRQRPLLALLFLLPALSVAGLPPFSGFWGKLALVQAALIREQYLAVTAALGVSILTLLYLVRAWSEVFWKGRPAGSEGSARSLPALQRRQMVGPLTALVLVMMLMGLTAEPFMVLARTAAEQLLAPDRYITTILGVTP
ncbi:Na+/H+ antiporter subunit D [Trichlorobacter ammonificans]|uniref:Na(+)/H(+) antiporter subunit D n=1 Tax=Trichlorobacter ammonificans TaxID=2916410 RepID=A0ABN8HI86_9BACT|nr:Na+/H+ antiporter subunit D [Trichlorobacter ammonificans]CAH2030902.1 Na(+)/H(+) antiporter subunit D [Trichlorobacter ammonificans]